MAFFLSKKGTNMKIVTYDTTLRDGMQGEEIFFTVEEKLKVALKLDDIGINYIEGGWPGSNPKDTEFFKKIKKIKLKNSKITAFGSTRKPDIKPENDFNLKALIDSETDIVVIVGKSWDLHVKKALNTTLEENLLMIEDSIDFLKKKGKEVFYDAEHFFDGFKENKEYTLKTILSAVKGGANYIVLCDTNGGTLTKELEEIIEETKIFFKKNNVNTPLGIHTHNDCNLAVANSIASVEQGVKMVQGTINGYGERCGNADLTSILPILELKLKHKTIGKKNLKKLKNLSRFVSETANMVPYKRRPFVGESAFAHKGGIHVSAINKSSKTYEHIKPELVGNTQNVIVSDLSGKSNIVNKAKKFGITLSDEEIHKVLQEIKNLENKGFQFDAADASLKIFIEKLTKKFQPFFKLKKFRVTIEKDKSLNCYSYATVKVSVGKKSVISAAEGEGPVSALDNAIRDALKGFYEELKCMQLVDFKVRILDGRDGTGAIVRVLIDSRDKKEVWTTIGVSHDIIEASWQALADSFHYKLSKSKNKE